MVAFQWNYLACLLSIGVLGSCDYSAPIVTRVEVVENGALRLYSIQYLSNHKPDILWRVSSFFRLVNTTHNFNGFEGESSVRINMTYFVNYNSVPVKCRLYTPDFIMKVKFNNNITVSSQPRSNLLRPIQFRADRSGEISFEKGEIISVGMTLESESLGRFEMTDTWGRLMSLDYGSVPYSPVYQHSVPYRLEHSFRRRNAVVIPPMNISSTSTSASTTAEIDTSFDYVEGELMVSVGILPKETADLISVMSLHRIVWLKESGHDAPFRNFINFYRSDDNTKRTRYLSPSLPFMEFDVIGYPEPDISVFKDCGEVGETVVEKIVVRRPYNLQVFYFFKNVTDDLGGSYYVTITNGDDSVSKQNFVTVL